MKKIAFNLVFLALVMFAFSLTPAWAQKPLKGSWTFTLTTPMGALPVPIAFKAKGKGTVSSPAGQLNLAYRENGANFSLVFEGPGLNPTGGDLTFFVRGTRTDSAVTATGYAITDTADPSSPIGFVSLVVPISGARNK